MTRTSTDSTSPTIAWGAPVDGLRLGTAPHGAEIDLYLHNTGSAPLEVLSHVDAGRRHYDWYMLQVQDRQGTTRTITLLDDRDESAIVRATLAPGENLHHTIDVNRWARLEANGGELFAAGTYELSAVYDAPPRGEAWAGHIQAGPVAWVLRSGEHDPCS